LGEFTTIKYLSNGNMAWIRKIQGTGPFPNFGRGIVLDPDGNICVTGSYFDTLTLFDCATARYTPEGILLWFIRYNNDTYFNRDEANAIEIDQTGNIYIAGRTSVYEYLTIKYTPDGETSWVRVYSGPNDALDIAFELDVDSMGNVYVTGTSGTVKYSPNGQQLWASNVFGQGNSVIANDDGSAYVACSTEVGFPRYRVIKYGPNGDTIWLRNYPSDGSTWGSTSGITVDKVGNIVATGHTYNVESSRDYTTVKFSPDGDTLWVRHYDSGENGTDLAFDIAVDDSGNCYVTGSSYVTESQEDYLTLKYSPEGVLLSELRYNDPDNLRDFAHDVEVDEYGNIYVTGSSDMHPQGSDILTIKYSPCSAIPGDINASNDMTLGDIVHLLNYVFDRDNPPCIGIDPGNCWDFGLNCRGDVNSSGTITLGDIIHLLNYVFDRDYPPCVGTDPGNCWTPVANGACCQPVP
jgi:uncharacterized delta-60 repeat protein